MKTRILVVDDHPIFRAGLKNILNLEDKLEVCWEAGTVADALELFRKERPDFIILDLNLGDGSGLDLIRRFRTSSRLTKILVASMHNELLYAERTMRAGADGYLCKDDALGSLVKAIYEILTAGYYISPRLSRHIAKKHVLGTTDLEGVPETVLSDRELEVFTMTGRGKSTRDIAQNLSLSVKTVDIYGCLPDFKDNDDCRSRTYIRSLYGAILRLTMMRSAPLRLFTHSVFDLCPFRLCRGPETGYVIILCNLVWRAYKSRSFYAAILRTS
nr:response regulator transcription factor [Hahella ganghwensis]